MCENRPNLRRRMGSFVAKPEPGELLFLHVIQPNHIIIMVFILVNIIIICIATFIHKMQLKVLLEEVKKII